MFRTSLPLVVVVEVVVPQALLLVGLLTISGRSSALGLEVGRWGGGGEGGARSVVVLSAFFATAGCGECKLQAGWWPWRLVPSWQRLCVMPGDVICASGSDSVACGYTWLLSPWRGGESWGCRLQWSTSVWSSG